MLLEDNPRGLLLYRDELSGWFASFCRYKDSKTGGTDLPQWLEFHRAGTLIVDRKTGDRPSLFIRRAAVCVAGTIQPNTFARVLTPEYMEAGMGARLLFAMPNRRRKHWTDAQIDPLANMAYERLLDNLLALQFDREEDGTVRPHALGLASDAKTEWVKFYESWAAEQAVASGDWAATLAKLEGYTARFALMHHVVTNAADPADLGPIQLESVEAAVCLTNWFAYEMRRVYAHFLETEEEKMHRELTGTIAASGGRISVRQLQRSNTRYRTAAQAEAELETLVAASKGRWEQVTHAHAGRPVKVFVSDWDKSTI
jgi:hypothetical protein